MSATKPARNRTQRAARSAGTGAKRIAPAEASMIPVTRIMTMPATTVSPELGIDSLREMMLERGLSRVPVTDAQGGCVGIVSFTDLVLDDHDSGGEVQEEASAPQVSDGFHVHDAGKNVIDVMSRTVLSIPESSSVAQAAELLVAHHLHGAPVCSTNGRIVGFVSSSDILAWLAGAR